MSEFKEFTKVKVIETGDIGVIVDKRIYPDSNGYVYTVEFSEKYPPHHLMKYKYNELEVIKE